MRVAVTGATGLVGEQAAGAAAAAGHEVVAVTRDGRHDTMRIGSRTVQRVTAPLTDAEALRRALHGCDGLIHCAAVYAFGSTRAEEVARVNADGTATVLEAAADAGVGRAVVTSSSVTCGSSLLPRTRTEQDRLGDEPSPAYYASKAAQETAALEVAQRRGLAVVLALPTVVLGGPYRRLGPSNAIVLRYLLDPTRSTFSGGCNVVDARDIGAGHVMLLERGEPGARYLLGGEDLTWRALHSIVADLAGLPGPYAGIPGGAARAVAAAAEGWASLVGREPLSTREEAGTVGRHYWYSSARARRLGYAARPAREAVAASLAWLAVGDDLPRWVREGLRLRPEVRGARALIPRALAAEEARQLTPSLRRRPRRTPPTSPRRPH